VSEPSEMKPNLVDKTCSNDCATIESYTIERAVMTIFPLAPDQTIAQMWSNGARGGGSWTILACEITDRCWHSI